MPHFQQPAFNFMPQYQPPQQQGQGPMHAGTNSLNTSIDSQARNISIDSDMAYDGIEELLIDSILDGQDSRGLAAPPNHALHPQFGGRPS